MHTLALTPCPFCGGRAVVEEVDVGRYAACCLRPTCLTTGPIGDSSLDAQRRWEQRCAPQASRPTLAESHGLSPDSSTWRLAVVTGIALLLMAARLLVP